MEIDAQIAFHFDNLAGHPSFDALSEDDQRGVWVVAVNDHVMSAAAEELRSRGLKPKRKIKQPGGPNEKETGFDVMVNRLGEHHVKFSVAFAGDYDSAAAATDAWAERVATLRGIAKIGHTSLRGTDGTNLHVFDEETEAMAASLDDETIELINKAMRDAEGGKGH